MSEVIEYIEEDGFRRLATDDGEDGNGFGAGRWAASLDGVLWYRWTMPLETVGMGCSFADAVLWVGEGTVHDP